MQEPEDWQGYQVACPGMAVFGLYGRVLIMEGWPPVKLQPVPASSKRNPLLAKAEPMSNAAGCASVTACVRKGKNAAQQ